MSSILHSVKTYFSQYNPYKRGLYEENTELKRKRELERKIEHLRKIKMLELGF